MMRFPGSTLISGLRARLKSLVHGVRRRDGVESEMAEEFQHHIELRTSDLIRRGMPPQEAARRARIEFGHIESHREDARASRGLRFFDQLRFSWLDVKLGLRMLAKYPGLSLVAVVGMTVAIAIGAGSFAAIYTMMDSTLPLHEGERVVSIQNTNAKNPGNPDRRAVHDFVQWRTELTSIQDLGAFTTVSRNLVRPDGSTALVQVAQMTPSGFRVARVAPFLGRPLVDGDERAGAPPVVVITYEDWQRDFGADPDIIGRSIRLGSALHTVVGVMPEGFRFPVNHRFWVPLRLDPDAYERGAGPSIEMFGRLAPGVTIEEAQAQIATIGSRNAAAYPDTHAHLRPKVLPYTHPFFDIDSPAMVMAMHAMQVAISLLLVVIAANVSILVYARTATRIGEIAVRSALGASRMRVVIQLFVEALVLSGTAAVLGLGIASVALARANEALRSAWGEQFPFWFNLGLSGGIVLYVVGLAALAAGIVGVLPALKATGRRVQAGLQQISSRGSQMQLGRTWTTLIILQVAIAVAVLPYALYIAGQSISRGTADASYPADELLGAYLTIERDAGTPSAEAEAHAAATEARFLARTEELLRRLEAEAAVAGVTFASHTPGREWYGRIEVEGIGSQSVRINHVDPDLFSAFDVAVMAGRGFVQADAQQDPSAVIVDRVLAEKIGAADAVGRRVRVLSRNREGELEQGPWLEIVGIVPDFMIPSDFEPADARLYVPVTLAGAYRAGVGDAISLAVRVHDTPALSFAGRLREITTAVDPGLQLHDLQSAADVHRMQQQSLRFIAFGVTAVTFSVLLLSAAGIYAMMSFTVARRRREIGIRSALGADARRVLGSIFARASAQLGAGVLGGLIVAFALDRAFVSGPLSGNGWVLLPLVAMLMVSIGLLAALGPARRGLAVQPTEALREE